MTGLVDTALPRLEPEGRKDGFGFDGLFALPQQGDRNADGFRQCLGNRMGKLSSPKPPIIELSITTAKELRPEFPVYAEGRQDCR